MPDQEKQQWQDLFFRHTFGDTGLYPTPGTQCYSPDVIPGGERFFSDPEQLLADSNWETDFGSSTNALEPNYIYLRGQNLGTKRTRGRLHLYASPSALLMYPTNPLDPSKGWSTNPLRTSAGSEYVEVEPAAGERFVGPEPFRWIPQPIEGEHYCLVGRVVTEDHPNEIPTTGNLNDFARYISEHPNLAWRNVVTRNPTSPVWTILTEYSQGDIGGEVYFQLVCTNAPDGSMVSFSSAAGGPEPPLYLPKTEVKNSLKNGVPTFVATLLTEIPENYQTFVSITWYSENKVPLPDMDFTLVPLMPLGGRSTWDPELIRYAQPLEAFGIQSRRAGPTHAIPLGSQTMRAMPVHARQPLVPQHGRRTIVPVGSGTARDTDPARSALTVAGFTWTERRASVLSVAQTPHQATIERSTKDEVTAEVLRISERTSPQGPDPDSDLTCDTDLNVGQYGGDAYFNLVATNVPNGCEIWFANVDGSVSIMVPPTMVSRSPFTVATLVNLPVDYRCTVRSHLRLNGNTLPADWSLRLVALHLLDPDGTRPSTPRVMVNPGPVPGIVLGSVTVTG